MGEFRKEAEATFKTFCSMLDQIGWKYDTDVSDLSITTTAVGEDLPMEMHIFMDEDAGRMLVLSQLPVKMSEEKRIDAAIVINHFNWCRMIGCLDYDVTTGRIMYRLSTCFADAVVGEALCGVLLKSSIEIVDKFNDQFLMLNKGMLTMEQMIENM
ncbi:MAG: hypothetical protein SOY12_01500 [Schaedlerella sp.]|nr:YbjN domain-containing protein [Lachnospiraceae bacterium]MDY4201732.1 hypothetical protein [Schaedlerella sp.]